MKPNGGAVGAFGDTRDPRAWHNTQIALGFADALLPGVLPAEGPATRQRVGDALIHGKMRLAGMAPLRPGTAGRKHSQRALPVALLRRPDDADVGRATVSSSSTRPVHRCVRAGRPAAAARPAAVLGDRERAAGLNGETLSILSKGNVVGKAVVTGDTVRIPASLADGSKPVGQLQVALEATAPRRS